MVPMVFIWNPPGMFAQHNSSSIYRTFCFVSKKCSKACFRWQTKTFLRKGPRIGEEDESNFRNLYLENSEAAAFHGCINVRRNPNIEVIQISFHFTSSFCCPHLWRCFSFIWGTLINVTLLIFKNLFIFSIYWVIICLSQNILRQAATPAVLKHSVFKSGI